MIDVPAEVADTPASRLRALSKFRGIHNVP
jgi:hypothetical protein